MRFVCLWFVLAAGLWSRSVFAQKPDSSSLDPSMPVTSFGTTVVVPGGLRGSISEIPADTTVLPDFDHDPIRRIGEVWTDSLNIPPRHWQSGFPGLSDRFEWFAIDYSGRFWIEEPGRYAFALISDDGSRLFVDGVPLIDNDCQHPPDLRTAAVELAGGVHQIRLSYFQGPRDCIALVLAIAGPGQHWQVFNTSEFKPPQNPLDWKYPQLKAAVVVPTKPSEAALSVAQLLAAIGSDKPEGKRRSKFKGMSNCFAPAVRICSR